MAQATTPGHPRLPCSPKQALSLYQLLFQRPADLGQLQNTIQQVHEGWDYPPGLELLEMKGSQRAQEKLLWDLELLAGVGLGLFWPPRARLCSQSGQTQHAWSQRSQTSGRTVDEDLEPLSSKLCSSPQAVEAHSKSHQLLKGRLYAESPSTSDLDEARSDGGPRLEGCIIPAETEPGTPTGEGQEAKGAAAPGAGCLHPTSSSSFKEPGNSKLKDPEKMEERSQAEPNIQSSCGQTLRSTLEEKVGQEAPEPSGLASQGLSALQDRSTEFGSGLGQEGAEPEMALTPQGHPEPPLGQRGQSPQGYKGESIQGQDKGVLQSQSERKEAQQGQELKTPRFGEGNNSEVWGGKTTAWRQEESNPKSHPSDFCKFPEKRVAGPQDSSSQAAQAAVTQEGGRAPLPAARSTQPLLRGPEVLASEAQECQPRLPSALREQSGPRDPKPSKAAWPAPQSREEVLASAGQEVLQQLLELNSAARQRRRRDREQQRLRVLERLRIVANRHRRVHPLGLAPSVAQMTPQEDVAGRQRILRELLGQVKYTEAGLCNCGHWGNAQNFQELLSPGTEEPSPGE